jgi:hypothetical protein
LALLYFRCRFYFFDEFFDRVVAFDEVAVDADVAPDPVGAMGVGVEFDGSDSGQVLIEI